MNSGSWTVWTTLFGFTLSMKLSQVESIRAGLSLALVHKHVKWVWNHPHKHVHIPANQTSLRLAWSFQNYILFVSRIENSRLGDPLDEIVTISVHKYSVIMSRPWWRHLIRETRCQDVGCFIEIIVHFKLHNPGGLCLGGLCPGRSLRGGGGLSGHLYPWGSLSGGVSVQGWRVPPYLGEGVSVHGVSIWGERVEGLCLGVSIQRETPSTVDRITDASKNITLPHTSFAGGKNVL